MARARQWFTCCGVGCGLAVLLAALIGGGGFLLVKRAVVGLDESRDSIDVLVARHGRIVDYEPAPDGSLSRERLEAYLEVREAMADEAADLERSLASLERVRGDRRFTPASIFEALQAAGQLLPRGKNYLDARTGALLDAGMGLGEYAYIYVLANYVWLQRSPASGPGFRLFGDYDDHDDFAVREARLRRNLGYLNRVLLQMLRRQRRELDDSGAYRGDVAWSEALDAEIAALEADPWRLPWADGLPPAIEASLEPYRDRFEAAWLPLTNAVEWGVRPDAR